MVWVNAYQLSGETYENTNRFMTAQLIIKARTPWKFWLQTVSIIIACLVGAWAAYMWGYKHAGYENERLIQAQDGLHDQIERLSEKNSGLRNKYTHLERSTFLDKQAFSGVDTTLHDLQDEVLELKEEIAFYRGIVSPVETASGLNITSMEVARLGNASGYHFKLVLTQVMKNDKTVKGKANLSIEGILDGTQKTLSLKQLSGGHIKTLKLKFKYFQNFEGDIVFPNNFVPSRLIVTISPSGKGLSRIKKTFRWSDIAT